MLRRSTQRTHVLLWCCKLVAAPLCVFILLFCFSEWVCASSAGLVGMRSLWSSCIIPSLLGGSYESHTTFLRDRVHEDFPLSPWRQSSLRWNSGFGSSSSWCRSTRRQVPTRGHRLADPFSGMARRENDSIHEHVRTDLPVLPSFD